MNEITIHCGTCTRTFPFCHPSVTRAAQLVNLSILCPHCQVEQVMPATEVHFVPKVSETHRDLTQALENTEKILEALRLVGPDHPITMGLGVKKEGNDLPPTPKVMPPHPPEIEARVVSIDRPRKPRTRRPHLGQRPFQGLKDLIDPS